MKQETSKTKKQKQLACVKKGKPGCGTLSYMAECRGLTQKDVAIRWEAPPDSNDKRVRK